MKATVLVVDDQKEIVDFLEKFLSRFNVSVVKATGGRDALQCIQTRTLDCIFLDIQMPEVDGFAVLQEVKKKSPRLPVIMITGKEDKESQEKAKKLGAVDYITKPLDLQELSIRVKEYIL